MPDEIQELKSALVLVAHQRDFLRKGVEAIRDAGHASVDTKAACVSLLLDLHSNKP